jgi:hypothetical protein
MTLFNSSIFLRDRNWKRKSRYPKVLQDLLCCMDVPNAVWDNYARKPMSKNIFVIYIDEMLIEG